ncbi:MAG TPA: substrate-binding domain-containing protein [Xanthobacteraceae bacterium]|jgi:ABC-type branched-subunit amino acid transport system substrate-binding protein|nr:substrate-binding domain-containing protein [Xanthobacteraceae bacterium]
MSIRKQGFTRRTLLGATARGVAFGALPGLIRPAAAADEFKIGLFIALSGPASLFGPTQKASAELATEEINKAGGILGRQIRLIPTDAGGPPAESTKSAIRLMLDEKVDMLVGSHDSATREALVATIKGKVPYIYTPVYEGGECAFNTYVIADTPEQQIRPSVAFMMKDRGAKSVYLIGDDYVWPRKCNEQAKKYIADNGGKVVAEEYVPFGAPNKFEEIVTRIKSAKPDMVLITLVGADNVNFNRTFAGFGLDKDIARLSLLLEENTLLGIGPDSSNNLFSSMSYYANAPGEANKKFKAAYFAKFGDKAPQLGLIGADCYGGIYCAHALATKAGGTDAKKCMAASEGLSFPTAAGSVAMRGRHVDKTMYLATCKGTEFDIIKTFADIKSGDECKA